MLERTDKLRLTVTNQFTQGQRCLSGKKKSMKVQMDIPSAEEQVRQNEEMRKALSEGRKVTKAKVPSGSRVFGLSLLAGVAYGLFQQYSLSGQGKEPEKGRVENTTEHIIGKEEITIIRRRKDINSN